ncbi:unnamed protein product [Ectocarpus sp. 4 AP-2014]
MATDNRQGPRGLTRFNKWPFAHTRAKYCLMCFCSRMLNAREFVWWRFLRALKHHPRTVQHELDTWGAEVCKRKVWPCLHTGIPRCLLSGRTLSTTSFIHSGPAPKARRLSLLYSSFSTLPPLPTPFPSTSSSSILSITLSTSSSL